MGNTNASKAIEPSKLSDEQRNVLEKISPNAMRTASEHEEASKTLATGYETNPADQTDGAVLRPEELDTEITLLTYDESDLNFFNKVPRDRVETTVYQYAVQTDHGGAGPQRFVDEYSISKVTDPRLSKKAIRMKFLSDTKRQTIANRLSAKLEDPTRLLTRDAVINIAKSIEWAAFYGDSDLTADPSSEGVQFDGLAKLIDPDNVIDVRGESLSEEILNEAAVIVGKGYGTPTDAFMPIGVQAKFVNSYLNRQTQLVADNSNNVALGYNVQRFNSVRGPIELHGSTIMELDNILDEKALARDAASSPMAPKVTATVAPGRGQFSGEGDLTNYSYKVVVVGTDSNSRPSEAVEAAVTNATDAVSLKIDVASMYQAEPQYVSIYRQGKTDGSYWLIGNVAVSELDNGSLTFVDENNVLPETADVFIGEMSSSVLSLLEFFPMTRIPLAQQDATLTFTVLWYGALALRAPRKWVQIKNVNAITVKDPFNANPGGHSF